MESVQELIDKLGKQHQQQETPERLLQTVQSLKELLTGMVRKETPASGKVAVVLPQKRRATTVEIGGTPLPAPKPLPPVAKEPAAPAAVTNLTTHTEDKKPDVPAPEAAQNQEKSEFAPDDQAAIVQPQMPYMPPADTEAAEIKPAPETPAGYAAYMPVPEPQAEKAPYLLQKPPAPAPVAPPAQSPQWEEREVYHLHFDTPDEAAPTLTQQQYGKAPKEVHELIGEVKESLNDRLKQDKPELAHKLKEAPIKDLRKAIGVNDKFQFVRELFRDDEAMYERSLKTINNFHILAEAEYWISRELKVKLGWDDGSHAVQAFYQLVKRRFS
jgi:hypothetical protein